MSDKELPREPGEDIKEKQDPEYSEADFRRDLFRVTKPKGDESDEIEEVTQRPSRPD